MSIFVAWLVSTILAVGTTVARFLTEIEVLSWIFIPMWIVDLILFFAMLFNWVTKMEEAASRYYQLKSPFVVSLIATIVTLALIFFTSVYKIPIWIPIVAGVITFIVFCYFFYMLSDTIDDLYKEREEKKKEEEERRWRRSLY